MVPDDGAVLARARHRRGLDAMRARRIRQVVARTQAVVSAWPCVGRYDARQTNVYVKKLSMLLSAVGRRDGVAFAVARGDGPRDLSPNRALVLRASNVARWRDCWPVRPSAATSHPIGCPFEDHVERAARVKGQSELEVARRVVSAVVVNVAVDVGDVPKGGLKPSPDRPDQRLPLTSSFTRAGTS